MYPLNEEDIQPCILQVGVVYLTYTTAHAQKNRHSNNNQRAVSIICDIYLCTYSTALN